MKTGRTKGARAAETPLPHDLPERRDTVRGESSLDRRRLHPKLQMIRNCDPDINQVRAELSASLFVPAPQADIPAMRGPDTIPQQAGYVAATGKKKDWLPDTRSRVNVFVDLVREDVAPLPGERYRVGTLALAEVAVAELTDITGRDGVTMVNPAEASQLNSGAQINANYRCARRKCHTINIDKS